MYLEQILQQEKAIALSAVKGHVLHMLIGNPGEEIGGRLGLVCSSASCGDMNSVSLPGY